MAEKQLTAEPQAYQTSSPASPRTSVAPPMGIEEHVALESDMRQGHSTDVDGPSPMPGQSQGISERFNLRLLKS